MCYPVTCRTCGKTTWAGCGAHVDALRAAVPPPRWCGGHEDTNTPTDPAFTNHAAAAGNPPAGQAPPSRGSGRRRMGGRGIRWGR
ncbi:hypothetical protein C5E43_24765 [Nocardia cyriacigeorgica]|nr:hypothetical protein C5E43_24765 [Nocardia cyriacigeorgica]